MGSHFGFWRVLSEMSMTERPEVDGDFILSLLSSRGHCPSERPGQFLAWGPPSSWVPVSSLAGWGAAGGVCSSLALGGPAGVPSGFWSCPGRRPYTKWQSPSSPRAAFAPERDPPPSWGWAPARRAVSLLCGPGSWGFSPQSLRQAPCSGTVHTVEPDEMTLACGGEACDTRATTNLPQEHNRKAHPLPIPSPARLTGLRPPNNP